MPELPDEQDIQDLFDRLNELKSTLPPKQAALLGAILKVAGDVVDDSTLQDDLAFSDQFAAAFTPFTSHQVTLVMDYAAAHHGMIVRHPTPQQSGSASPAMIVRGGTGGVATPTSPPTPPPPTPPAQS